MRLKRYTAPTMSDALKLIKNELGKDAVILSTRKIKNSEGQPTLEITAAIDEEPQPAEFKPASQREEIINPQLPPMRFSPEDIQGFSHGDFKDNATRNPSLTPQRSQQTSLNNHLDEPVSKLQGMLHKHGVVCDISEKIMGAVNALAKSGFEDIDTLEMVLGKMVSFVHPANVLTKGKVHVFVGPTGCGKTTTLCKLAVQKRIDGNSIGLITLDNKKVGAFEQLNIYAEAMKEQAWLVKSADEFAPTMMSVGPKDFVLIDTPGVSPFDKTGIARIKEKLDALDAMGLEKVVHLVVPASMNPTEMVVIPTAYQDLNPDSVLFTKFDETSYLGGITNLAATSDLKVCYVTNGTRVPDDIVEIDAAMLAGELIKAPKMPWERM